MGTIQPILGEFTAPSGVADALFTRTQQSVLGLLFGQPDRTFFSSEIIRNIGAGTGAVHRELAKLEKAGLIDSRRIGNQKHFQANRANPIFTELQGIVTKTFGLVFPLRAALSPLAAHIVAAFVFGSVAKGTDHAKSDLDLMVISNDLEYADLFAALQPLEARIGRPINPSVLSLDDWKKKRRTKGFAARIGEQPRLFVMGSADVIDG